MLSFLEGGVCMANAWKVQALRIIMTATNFILICNKYTLAYGSSILSHIKLQLSNFICADMITILYVQIVKRKHPLTRIDIFFSLLWMNRPIQRYRSIILSVDYLNYHKDLAGLISLKYNLGYSLWMQQFILLMGLNSLVPQLSRKHIVSVPAIHTYKHRGNLSEKEKFLPSQAGEPQ